MRSLTVLLATVTLAASCGGESVTSEAESTLPPETSTTSTTTTIPMVVVPNVAEYDRDQAAEILRDQGLFATFTEEPSGEREGTVVGQSPEAGVEVEPGSTVELIYAVPALHEFWFTYDVKDNLWDRAEDGSCEDRRRGLWAGQSVRLVGPDGVTLSASLVQNGKLTRVSGVDGDLCRFRFVFKDVPEVASYTMTTNTTSFPTVPLQDVRGTWSADFTLER